MMVVLRASVHLWTGRTEAAVRRAQEALDIFQSIRDPVGELQALALLGRALVLVGRIDDGFHLFTETAARQSSVNRHDGVFMLPDTAAAAAATAIGDPDEALQWAEPDDVEWLDPALMGHDDRMVAIGLALAQSGRLEAGQEVLEAAARLDPDGGRSPNALAALALVCAALGHHDRGLAYANDVATCAGVTYADRVLAAVAQALVAARRGDNDAAAAALARARVLVADTDDHVHDAVIALADAVATASPEARASAREKLAALGIDATGWRTLFERITAAELV
jgi:tetratricopeptide (TPR) repeat protein